MNARITGWSFAIVLALGGLSGCQNCCKRHDPPATSCPVTTLPPGATVVPYGSQPPAGAIPVYPPVPQTGSANQAPPPPVQTGPDVRRYEPPPTWEPATSQAGYSAGAQQPEGVRLQSPKTTTITEPTPKPAVSENASLPVGIPGFASARERVASGQKPLLDGLDWLKDNGYRAVLHLRAAGEGDVADRRQVEKRGMRFYSLEIAPETLTKATVEDFTRIVTDAANEPLFVYDRDGNTAGGTWYLYFRTAERQTDEQARVRAQRLGLKDAQSPEQRAMWLAIQKYVSDNLR
jgi:protein tyrosine phosphatase (PTP) superfamily phosphohydrolase (DUF442 family)